jgi:O-antigen/teichoic acid export membrane protein
VTEQNSYRQILRATSITASASVINIVIGIVRTKILAVMLGPAGVGVAGLLQNLMATASTVSAMGVGTVGTRQITQASADGEAARVAEARKVLLGGTLLLAAVGAAVFWLCRGLLAERIMHDAGYAQALGWLAIGVALTVAAGSQTALLNGLRRIGDLAKISVGSAALTTLLGVAAIVLLGDRGLVLLVLAAPLASVLFGLYYVGRLRDGRPPVVGVSRVLREFAGLAREGVPFMVTGLVAPVGQLLIRTVVQGRLGADALGQFQAAAGISITYVGFILSAMSKDYYPRLTMALRDPKAAALLVNQQAEVGVLLAAPVLLAMLTLAPSVVALLYTREFTVAADILRWQVLGDMLKVASWPIAFTIVAAGAGRLFLATELLGTATWVLFTWLGLPRLGIEAAGVAYFLMYLLYLPLVYMLARHRIGFRFERTLVRHLCALAVAMAVVLLLAGISSALSIAVGLALSAASLVFGFVRLSAAAALGGRMGSLQRRIQRLLDRSSR